MGLKTAKRLAADMMSVGLSRVWIDPERLEDVESAVTRGDVRRLISEGVIRKRPPSNPSKGRLRLKLMAKKKGRRSGPGSRKGTRRGGVGWVEKVRAQRKLLKDLRDKGEISRSVYRELYYKVKGGVFASKRALLEQVESLKGVEERGR
ncbi:MAG: 50S ribosomal protein L19e [Candidatus Bathyarchaeia archaeon]